MALAALALVSAPCASSREVLHVCAAPDNLPFSDRESRGFDNQIVELVARDLDRDVAYTWFPDRAANKCDVAIGMPASATTTTRPYYRSSYVFVTRADQHLGITSLDDPRLHGLRIGVPAIGAGYANAPPAEALARRGLQDRLVGYRPYRRALADALVRNDIDVAIAWGPLAGWTAMQSPVSLAIVPIDHPDGEPLPFAFDIAMGVREQDPAIKQALDRAIGRQGAAITAVLARFDVP